MKRPRLNWMVTNSAGKRDATLTFALGAFLIAGAKVLASGVVFYVAGKELKLGTADAATIAALLTPTLGAYVARRHTESMYGPDGIAGTADDPKEEEEIGSGREPKDA